ncbi:MAG TPA: ATP-binding protein, partial [Gammaproteobacteria bacterium]|nr:ATP-binding protein [Gammaproteobacteria bacterium]
GRLVDDLLDLSRITQGRIALKREPVELGGAVLLALESVQPLLTAKEHELTVVGSLTPLHVSGDRSRLVQAIANVLTNAAKYTEAGGRVRVALSEADGDAVIEVSDTGAGIPPELLPHVFDLFVQGQRTADRAQGGLGIGLSVVRRLVQLHGGSVAARSEGAGKGTTVEIRLPLSSPPTAPAERPAPGRRSNGRRMLVVDDNADAADSLAEILRLNGFDAWTAYDGHQALDRLRETHVDVVLLDIGLPGMDGYEVARRVREEHGALVLVAITGYGQAADVQRAKDAGFNAHITKPVEFDELARVLSQL